MRFLHKITHSSYSTFLLLRHPEELAQTFSCCKLKFNRKLKCGHKLSDFPHGHYLNSLISHPFTSLLCTPVYVRNIQFFNYISFRLVILYYQERKTWLHMWDVSKCVQFPNTTQEDMFQSKKSMSGPIVSQQL